jgi:NAD(P)-dependent dehydrogenase (short-subunit alcohol dehydrogenase family)
MVDTGMQADVQASTLMPNLPPPYIPIGRSAQPSEIAQLAVWLCSDASSYLVGEAIGADGGWRIV